MVGHLICFAVVISTAVIEATSQAKCENAFSCWKGEKRGVCTGIGQTINATKDNETTCWCEEYNGYSPDRPKECWEQGTPSACVCTQCPNGSMPIIRKENCEFITEFNKEEHCATPGSTITTSIPISDNAQGSCNSEALKTNDATLAIVSTLLSVVIVVLVVLVVLCLYFRSQIKSCLSCLERKNNNHEQAMDNTESESTFAYLKEIGKAKVFSWEICPNTTLKGVVYNEEDKSLQVLRGGYCVVYCQLRLNVPTGVPDEDLFFKFQKKTENGWEDIHTKSQSTYTRDKAFSFSVSEIIHLKDKEIVRAHFSHEQYIKIDSEHNSYGLYKVSSK